VMPEISELFTRSAAHKYLSEGRIVLLGGGTGNPFFTTDTTAVLRAAEIGAQAVLKATNVDGVYSADPKKDPSAKRFDRLTHSQAIAGDYKVMDATAFALARETSLPIIVFSIAEPGSIGAILRGTGHGTVVAGCHAGVLRTAGFKTPAAGFLGGESVMPTPGFDINELKRRMQGATQSLKHELGGLRTGRAAASMLEPVQVEAYGSHMPLNQLATVSVPEPRLLSVQVWDKSMVKAVEKAIVDSNLGLSPATEGQVLRLRIPELNEERRKELVKVAHKYAEAAKVAVRHVRRDGLDIVKKLEKNHEISEDDQERLAHEVQKATDGTIAEIDQLLAAKEKEILTV
jgi:ribosome recycling factor